MNFWVDGTKGRTHTAAFNVKYKTENFVIGKDYRYLRIYAESWENS